MQAPYVQTTHAERSNGNKNVHSFCLVHQDVVLIVPEENLPYQKLYLLAAQHKRTLNQNCRITQQNYKSNSILTAKQFAFITQIVS